MIEQTREGMSGRCEKCVQQRSTAARHTKYAGGTFYALQWMLIFAFLLGAGVARAGTYTVSYTGNGCTLDGVSSSYYSSGPSHDSWGGGVGAGDPNFRGAHSASCSGAITVTFTWKGDVPSDLPPDEAIVYEYSSAGAIYQYAWTVFNSTIADDGLGDPVVNANSSPATGYYGSSRSSGQKYTIKKTPGKSFTITRSPSAASTVDLGGCSAAVIYEAQAQSVYVSLNGPIPTSAQDTTQNILIGQGCTARMPGIGGGFDNNLFWNVTFSPTSWTLPLTTFKSYVSTTASAVLNQLSAAEKKMPTVKFYWDKAGMSTVKVTATASAAGKVIGTVTAHIAVKVWEPVSTCIVSTDSIYVIEDDATKIDALVTGDIAIPPFPHTPHDGVGFRGTVLEDPLSPFAAGFSAGGGKW